MNPAPSKKEKELFQIATLLIPRRLQLPLLVLSILICAACASRPAASTPSPSAVVASDSSDRKIIEWGWGTPAVKDIPARIDQMQKIPFDGLVLDLTFDDSPAATGTKGKLGWQVWSNQRFTEAQLSRDIQLLSQIPWGRFTENFLRFNVTPGHIDWFDPAFDNVLSNAALVARIARRAGFKGILFDTEHYAGSPFSYSAQPQKSLHAFADYQAQARLRGRQLMEHFQREFPDLTILLTYGYFMPNQQAAPPSLFQQSQYPLLPPMLDGMLQAARGKTRIHDGWEFAYAYTRPAQFAHARRVMRLHAPQWSDVPDLVQKRYRAGFGLWIDEGGKVWNTSDFSKNHFNPQQFQESLRLALSYSDRYVWIYSHQARWWDGKVPQAYIDTLDAARRTADPSLAAKPMPPVPASERYLSSKNRPEAADQPTFGDLLATHDLVLDLPEHGWRFQPDIYDQGLSHRWFAPDFSDSSWPTIAIRQWWEPQGFEFDGYGWYRRTIDIPPVAANRKLLLAVGAADEAATVWINGQSAGSFDQGDKGWNQRFVLDVTPCLKPGQPNQITIRVRDSANLGGLWKGILLLTPR